MADSLAAQYRPASRHHRRGTDNGQASRSSGVSGADQSPSHRSSVPRPVVPWSPRSTAADAWERPLLRGPRADYPARPAACHRRRKNSQNAMFGPPKPNKVHETIRRGRGVRGNGVMPILVLLPCVPLRLFRHRNRAVRRSRISSDFIHEDPLCAFCCLPHFPLSHSSHALEMATKARLPLAVLRR